MQNTTHGLTKHGLATLGVALLTLSASSADAFCGFYVSGADGELFNSATMVVMMREGTHTVLSMQNHYDGPAEDFAMIVPVPVVLDEEHVRTLPDELFSRVDNLAAPRLVEYWEVDPCYREPEYEEGVVMMAPPSPVAASAGPGAADDLGVTIEAQFVVGEYEIVILSAEDSSGLDTWLRRESYNIPEGAEPLLRPYVEQGTKFFVARVDVEQVTRVDGRLVLSPLRFDYETEEFSLPVRLGLLNAEGAQDLIVHILARGQRYETANYENVTIPTNLVVSQGVRHEFGPFYTALFDRLVEQHPNHVVTEYSWDASSCDPCPTPSLTPEEIATLGADVVGGDPYGFTLTRLHHRYTREQLTEDLVFRPATALAGGRGVPNARGELVEGTTPTGGNNFQGRYVMLNWWDRPVSCGEPIRGRWGGPWQGPAPEPTAARDLAFAPRGRDLDAFLASDVPDLDTHAEHTEEAQPTRLVQESGCSDCAVGAQRPAPSYLFALAPLLGLLALRRRRP